MCLADLDVERIRSVSASAENGRHAVIATDDAGTILHWNKQATDLYGWMADEVLGRNVLDVMPVREAIGEAAGIMMQLLAGNEWAGSFLARHKNGAPLAVLVNDVPIRGSSGTVIGVVGVSTLLGPADHLADV